MGLFQGVQLDSYLLYSSNYFDIEALVVDSASESPPDVFFFLEFWTKGREFRLIKRNG